MIERKVKQLTLQQEMRKTIAKMATSSNHNQLLDNLKDSKADPLPSRLNFLEEALIPFLKTQHKIEEQMKAGAIPFGMWSECAHQIIVAKAGSESINQQILQREHEISEIEKARKGQMQEKAQLVAEIEELRETLKSQKALIQSEEAINILSYCENKLLSSFRSKFASENFTTNKLDPDEISIFMNLMGVSHHCRTLEEKGCKTGIALKNIVEQSELAKELNFTTKERLWVKFGMKMMKKKEFPPFRGHLRKCKLCKLKPSLFVKEYFPELKVEKVEISGLEVKEILMMKSEGIAREFGVDLIEALELGERMEGIREFHSSL